MHFRKLKRNLINRDQGVQQERMETEPESVLQLARLPTVPPPQILLKQVAMSSPSPIPIQQADMPPSLPQVLRTTII